MAFLVTLCALWAVNTVETTVRRRLSRRNGAGANPPAPRWRLRAHQVPGQAETAAQPGQDAGDAARRAADAPQPPVDGQARSGRRHRGRHRGRPRWPDPGPGLHPPRDQARRAGHLVHPRRGVHGPGPGPLRQRAARPGRPHRLRGGGPVLPAGPPDPLPGGLAPARIAGGGESAGGNLTVALCLYARDQHGPAISHQSVYYPFTDTSLSSADWDSGLMPGANRRAGELMVRLYAGHDPGNPLVNLLGADLRGLPPATVVTCGHDVLHSDGVRLAEAFRAAGVETRHTHHDDMPHGFLMLSRLTTRPDESMDEMAREVTKYLGTAERVAG